MQIPVSGMAQPAQMDIRRQTNQPEGNGRAGLWECLLKLIGLFWEKSAIPAGSSHSLHMPQDTVLAAEQLARRFRKKIGSPEHLRALRESNLPLSEHIRALRKLDVPIKHVCILAPVKQVHDEAGRLISEEMVHFSAKSAFTGIPHQMEKGGFSVKTSYHYDRHGKRVYRDEVVTDMETGQFVSMARYSENGRYARVRDEKETGRLRCAFDPDKLN